MLARERNSTELVTRARLYQIVSDVIEPRLQEPPCGCDPVESPGLAEDLAEAVTEILEPFLHVDD